MKFQDKPIFWVLFIGNTSKFLVILNIKHVLFYLLVILVVGEVEQYGLRQLAARVHANVRGHRQHVYGSGSASDLHRHQQLARKIPPEATTMQGTMLGGLSWPLTSQLWPLRMISVCVDDEPSHRKATLSSNNPRSLYVHFMAVCMSHNIHHHQQLAGKISPEAVEQRCSKDWAEPWPLWPLQILCLCIWWAVTQESDPSFCKRAFISCSFHNRVCVSHVFIRCSALDDASPWQGG